MNFSSYLAAIANPAEFENVFWMVLGAFWMLGGIVLLFKGIDIGKRGVKRG